MSNKYYPCLKEAWEHYQILKTIEQYQSVYKGYKYIKREFKKSLKNDNTEESVELLYLFIECLVTISRKWGIKKPIDPNLNIKEEDLSKPISVNSSVIKLIKAYELSAFPELKIKKTISKQRLAREKRVNKFLCYSISKHNKASNRELARRFKVNKDTITNWINEVDDWSKSEREAVTNEFLKHKHLYDIDASNLSKHFKIPLSKVEYGLTKNGIYKNGRKRIPKSPDEPTEETLKIAIRQFRKITSL